MNLCSSFSNQGVHKDALGLLKLLLANISVDNVSKLETVQRAPNKNWFRSVETDGGIRDAASCATASLQSNGKTHASRRARAAQCVGRMALG